MKKFISVLAAVLFSLPLVAQQYTYTSQAGVSLFTNTAATVTETSAPVRLPNFSGAGTLTVTESGITGSPSGCTFVLKYQGNNSVTATAAVSTTSFTPATGVQTFFISPTVSAGDNYVGVFACSVYPTAGLLTASFSPAVTTFTANTPGTGDPCQNPSVAKSTVSVAVTSATTTRLVALVTGAQVYVCDLALTTVGTSASVQLEYGTGATCGTGTTALTGAMVPSATVGVIKLGFGGTVTTAPASQSLCLVSGATVTSVEGVLSYVQQ